MNLRSRIDRLEKAIPAAAEPPPGPPVEIHLPDNGRDDPGPGRYDVAPGVVMVIYTAAGDDLKPV
jgi:hypothetical protein